MFRPTVLLLTVLLLALCNICVHAQQPSETLDDIIPDAPTPKTFSMSSDIQRQTNPPKKQKNKFEARSFQVLQTFFTSSVRADMDTTVDFLHHPQHVQYRGLCGGQPCKDVSYGYSPFWFTEVGSPARAFKCGLRSVDCSLTANLLSNATTFGLTEFLHRKGKLGKTIGWGLLTAQTVINFRAAWYNKHVVLNERLYVPTGATAIRWYNP